jgi:hypothetical protein
LYIARFLIIQKIFFFTFKIDELQEGFFLPEGAKFREKVSFSSIFYKQFVCAEVFCLQFGFCNFCLKENWCKAAREMLVILTKRTQMVSYA